MNTDLKILYNEFVTEVEKGDEKAARQFLVDNLLKFPKELQDGIIFALFEEGVLRAAEDGAAITKMQKQGFENLEALRRVQKKIEDELKIIKIQRDLDHHA